MSYAQKLPFSNQRISYFYYINLAELSITKNNFVLALSYYDSAFRVVSNPRDNDIYNKAVCYRKMDNDRIADSLFALLATKGFRKSKILNCFDTLKTPILQRQAIIVNNQNLDEIFEKIFNNDQKVNSYRYINMEMYAQKVIEHVKYIKDLSSSIDNLLAYDVGGRLWLPIFHFFQLKAIAERVKNDTLFKKKYTVYRCLEHFDFNEIKFYEFLKEEVVKGNYNNETFTELIKEMGYEFGMPVSQFDEFIIVRSPTVLCKDELQYINKNREIFGLETYENFYQKARYTDSLLTNGRPFSALEKDEYIKLYIDFNTQCNYNITENYRTMMEYTKPEDAQNVYERNLSNLCPK